MADPTPADFSITGSSTALKTFADGPGFDAEPGETLTLQLEASSASDIRSCVFTQIAKSPGSADLVIPGSGIATPTPFSSVDVPLPSDDLLHAYLLQAQVNGGETDTTNKEVAAWTKQRLVVVRAAGANASGEDYRGVRKVVAGERTQYLSGAEGAWAEAIDTIADLVGGGRFTNALSRRFETTDASNNDILTIAVPDNATLISQLFAYGRDQTTGDESIYWRSYVHKRSGGAPVAGPTIDHWLNEDDASWNASMVVSSNDVAVRLVGDASNDVTWIASSSWRIMTHS